MTIPNAGENAEKLELSYIAGMNVKWYSHSRKWSVSFFKKTKQNTHLSYNPAVVLLGIITREFQLLEKKQHNKNLVERIM